LCTFLSINKDRINVGKWSRRRRSNAWWERWWCIPIEDWLYVLSKDLELTITPATRSDVGVSSLSIDSRRWSRSVATMKSYCA